MDMQYEHDRNVMYRDEIESLNKELETLRAKLEKAEKVIDIVHGMRLWQQLDYELFEAVKEYRGEETK